MLREDRAAIDKSHRKNERRREGDEMLHLQLLDLALLSQADVLAGSFASTFIKVALQLGSARMYVSLDTFPWCPLLRCYWTWRDLCHNCEVCANQAGGGEACFDRGYHTARGFERQTRVASLERRPFAAFPFYGYGVARVVWAAGEEPSLAACEARCCDEPTCHSVTYDRNSSACTAGLAIAHGEPQLAAPTTVTSLRLPGGWEEEALAAAQRVLKGARLFRKSWRDPAGHTHPLERSLTPRGCGEGRGGARGARWREAVPISDLLADAIPHFDPRPGKGAAPTQEPACPEPAAGGDGAEGRASK
ncbi:hypothetical protein EMIHUDRAFT_456524 [Emiliania huxleyi CCMP1516]|uniref:Apple domain-containing protein n=2 Tax=Emiliania huxleyi TaxID=2903 RepID=A0A0D3K4I1_EMIH1|nr:hypothetical protein EMIHUDRAFT_456524 [Emiliania huxleyi CCMP1516]EOD30666.1 hypothetical protein EMIHUDRAFT_456524 [Emiliania huxleyi CCMP1516]|eukprot:XP_005783095.1 hypothetical protein EMIHUDRAFT_456524 [Emiliania huxleyi CCMP1516]